jgi:biotin carboxyl carrier protein
MGMLGQGLVLMIAGMTIVYLFLWVMIIICKHASLFVSRFSNIIPDDEPKKKRAAPVIVESAAVASPSSSGPTEGEEVKAPVPGTVLRVTAQDGQSVEKGDELLVMDVMKMETPMTAPRAGRVSIRVAAMDKVGTGDVLAVIGD